MKDLRSPTITPGLNHSPTFPMQGIGDQKTRSIGQVLSFMYDYQALASIPLQPDHLGEGKEHFLLAVTAAHLHRPETLWAVLSQLGSHFIHAPPAALPLNMAPNLHLTDQLLTATLNQTRQLQPFAVLQPMLIVARLGRLLGKTGG